MAHAYTCIDCGADIPYGKTRCPLHEAEDRRERRHSGYDDPAYRAARARKRGRPCERCGKHLTTSVHHRDGDPANNTPGNLQGVCDHCKPIVDAAMRTSRATARKLRPLRHESPWK